MTRLEKIIHEIADLTDHTLLKPEGTLADIQKLVHEAMNLNPDTGTQCPARGVCLRPHFIKNARELLSQNISTKLITVFGFPEGTSMTSEKITEAELAMQAGADGGDMVINVHDIFKNKPESVLKEIIQIGCAVFGNSGSEFKVIIEAAKLRALGGGDSVKQASLIVKKAFLGIAECFQNKQREEILSQCFIKTSTGFASEGGADIEDVLLMGRVVGPEISIKPAGGIRDLNAFLKMVRASRETGTEIQRSNSQVRIGTSACLSIIREVLVSGPERLGDIELDLGI